jgi:alkylhydroperoxidase family enzyme
VGRENGISDEKLLALASYATSEHYDEAERTILEYADAITLSDRDVSDELFAGIAERLTPEQVVELTFTVALENMLSKLHRALRVDAHGFCPVRLIEPGGRSGSAV